MKIKWDKVPERIHSESLKCLFCSVMARMLRKTNDLNASMTFCCSLMVVALTMDDDAAFRSEERLTQALICNKDFRGSLSEDQTAFLLQHKEYFLECTSRVLKSVRNCPDKPYNQRRSE